MLGALLGVEVRSGDKNVHWLEVVRVSSGKFGKYFNNSGKFGEVGYVPQIIFGETGTS